MGRNLTAGDGGFDYGNIDAYHRDVGGDGGDDDDVPRFPVLNSAQSNPYCPSDQPSSRIPTYSSIKVCLFVCLFFVFCFCFFRCASISRLYPCQ